MNENNPKFHKGISENSPSHEGTSINVTRARRGESSDTPQGNSRRKRQLSNGFIDTLTATLRRVPMLKNESSDAL